MIWKYEVEKMQNAEWTEQIKGRKSKRGGMRKIVCYTIAIRRRYFSEFISIICSSMVIVRLSSMATTLLLNRVSNTNSVSSDPYSIQQTTLCSINTYIHAIKPFYWNSPFSNFTLSSEVQFKLLHDLKNTTQLVRKSQSIINSFPHTHTGQVVDSILFACTS